MSMGTFWNIVEYVIDNSDYIIEVIDARMPEITRNVEAEDMVDKRNKKLIIVANKADFLSKDAMNEQRKYFGKTPIFFVSIRNRMGLKALKNGILKMAQNRSLFDDVNIGIIGYPNTGKSSLINALCGRSALIVGSRPGMTRHHQLVRMSANIMFVDTPGVVPVYEKDETKQLLMNTLDPANAKHIDGAAREIVRLFLEQNKSVFENMYRVKTDGKTFEDIVQGIGESNKMITKGSKVDIRRVYLKLIDDWQKGNILLRNRE
jgi:ribosome biogenesis GTPase A